MFFDQMTVLMKGIQRVHVSDEEQRCLVVFVFVFLVLVVVLSLFIMVPVKTVCKAVSLQTADSHISGSCIMTGMEWRTYLNLDFLSVLA